MSTSVLWELAHPDGSSIFVRQPLDTEGNRSLIFGPFLFLDADSLRATEGTLGPMGLLKALKSKRTQAQQVNLNWVLKQTRSGFKKTKPDCIVLGDILLPLSENGATFADAQVNTELQNAPVDWIFPWTDLAEGFGTFALRLYTARFIEKISIPETPS